MVNGTGAEDLARIKDLYEESRPAVGEGGKVWSLTTLFESVSKANEGMAGQPKRNRMSPESDRIRYV